MIIKIILNRIKEIKDELLRTNKYAYTEEEIIKQNKFKEEIKKLNFGDIICCKRYDYPWEEEYISEGHKYGPHIVIGKTEDKLICMYCTSVMNKKGYFLLSNEIDLLDKNTFTSLNNIRAIDYEAYMSYDRYYKSLSEDEKRRLLGNLSNLKQIKYEDLGLIKVLENNIKLELNSKDIIICNNKIYIIIDTVNNNYKCVRIKENELKYNSIDYTKFKYTKFNYLPNTINFKYYGTLSDYSYKVLINLIDKKEKEDKEEREVISNNIITLGTIIRYNDNTYYVYNINKNMAETVKVNISSNLIDNSIKINNKYMTFEFDTKLNISITNNKYQVIYLLNEDTRYLIKEKKKNYIRNNKKTINNKKKKLVSFNVGDIVRSKYLFGKTFIIFSVKDKDILMVDYESILDGKLNCYIQRGTDGIKKVNNYNKNELKLIRNNILYLELLNKKDYKSLKLRRL